MKTKIITLIAIMTLACPLVAKMTQEGILASQTRITMLAQSFQSAFTNLLDQIKSHYTVTINPSKKQITLNNITAMLKDMQTQIDNAAKEDTLFA